MKRATWFRLFRILGLGYLVWVSIKNAPMNTWVSVAWLVMVLVCYLSQEIGRYEERRTQSGRRWR